MFEEFLSKLTVDAVFDGEYWQAEVQLKVDDGYTTTAISRQQKKAIGYALISMGEALTKKKDR